MARRKSTAREQTGPLWSIPVAVVDVPESGRKLEVIADAATRAALAKAAGVDALPRLELSVELFRHGSDALHIVGQVSATVQQTCVVSLEPLQSEIVEPLDLLFVPQPTAGVAATVDAALDQGDPPEVLRDGVADIGAVAAEFAFLGIDPYPRKPGATFEAPPAGDDGGHPFAALAALKRQS